jgi:hypothetical protein
MDMESNVFSWIFFWIFKREFIFWIKVYYFITFGVLFVNGSPAFLLFIPFLGLFCVRCSELDYGFLTSCFR